MEKKTSINGAGITEGQQREDCKQIHISPDTKFKSKWIKELNISSLTLNLIEEKVPVQM